MTVYRKEYVFKFKDGMGTLENTDTKCMYFLTDAQSKLCCKSNIELDNIIYYLKLVQYEITMEITKDDIGRKFRTREGAIETVNDVSDHGIFPVITDKDSYTRRGFNVVGRENEYDLIERLDEIERSPKYEYIVQGPTVDLEFTVPKGTESLTIIQNGYRIQVTKE